MDDNVKLWKQQRKQYVEMFVELEIQNAGTSLRKRASSVVGSVHISNIDLAAFASMIAERPPLDLPAFVFLRCRDGFPG